MERVLVSDLHRGGAWGGRKIRVDNKRRAERDREGEVGMGARPPAVPSLYDP